MRNAGNQEKGEAKMPALARGRDRAGHRASERDLSAARAGFFGVGLRESPDHRQDNARTEAGHRSLTFFLHPSVSS